MLKRIKRFLFFANQKTPYIPDFGDVWTIFKILLVSLFLCIIYSFTQINKIMEFYSVFIHNIKIFTPYVIIQLVLFNLFANKIKNVKIIHSLAIIFILNVCSIYLVHLALSPTISSTFTNIDVIIVRLFTSLGVTFFFLIYFDWREKNTNPENTIAKLIFLQSKMRPHFLFNTLNSVLALMKKNPDLAKKIIVNLSDLLRVSLKEDNITMYTLQEEVDLCKKYLEIEQIRLGERLTVIWNIDQNIMNCKIPRLTLQPLLENCILHGIQNLEDGGRIHIDLIEKPDGLYIKFQNPIGKNKNMMDSINNSNHISIVNLKERLNIYFDGDVFFNHYQYGNNYFVDLLVPKRFKKEIN